MPCQRTEEKVIPRTYCLASCEQIREVTPRTYCLASEQMREVSPRTYCLASEQMREVTPRTAPPVADVQIAIELVKCSRDIKVKCYLDLQQRCKI